MKPTNFSAYYVTKHSWKGKYQRIFLIGSNFVQTLHPSNLQVTNEWPYNDLADICPSQDKQFEFTIVFKKSEHGLRFSCPHRSDLLTDVCRQWNRPSLSASNSFNTNASNMPTIRCDKLTWQCKWAPRMSRVTPYGILIYREDSDEVMSNQHENKADLINLIDDSAEIDESSTQCKKLCNGQQIGGGIQQPSIYYFNEIKQILFENNSLCIGLNVYNLIRLHLFRFRCTKEMEGFLQQMHDFSIRYIGLHLPKAKSIDRLEQYFQSNRFSAPYNDNRSKITLFEFVVSRDGKQKLLCITSTCLIERDPLSYRISFLYPLVSICMINRCIEDERRFEVIIASSGSGKVRAFNSSARDLILVSLLDNIKSAGNVDVYIVSRKLERGFRFAPFCEQIDRELEINLLRMLTENLSLKSLAVFCANVNYHTSSKHLNDQEKVITAALMNIVNFSTSSGLSNYSADSDYMENLLGVMKRLLALPCGCEQFSIRPQIRDGFGHLVKYAISQSSAIAYAAIEALNMLMQPTAQLSTASGQDLLREQRNKRFLLQSERFIGELLDLLAKHVREHTNSLLVMSLLDFFCLAVCAPFSETTDGTYFDQTLTMLAAKSGDILYDLVDEPNSLSIRRGASMLIQALIEESGFSISRQICEMSLTHCSIVCNLITALFGSGHSSDTAAITTPKQTIANGQNVDPAVTDFKRAARHLSSTTSQSMRNTLSSQAILRRLSRSLLDLWTSDGRNGPTFDLLCRCFPPGLLQYLTRTEQTFESTDYPNDTTSNFYIAEDETSILDRDNLGLLLAGNSNLTDTATSSSMTSMKSTLKNVETELNRILLHWRLSGIRTVRKALPSTGLRDNFIPGVSLTAYGAGRNDPSSSKIDNSSDVVVLRRRRAKPRKDSLNWALFYYQFYQDHCKPDLIWNYHTRQELKMRLQTEYDRFLQELDLAPVKRQICWNHREFKIVPYRCLSAELTVGDYYLRLLIDVNQSQFESSSKNSMDAFKEMFHEPTEFFSQLYHRFLLTPKRSRMRYACLRALALVYSSCYQKIGSFNDIGFILANLRQNSCGDRRERDLLIEFIDSLTLEETNSTELISKEGVQILVDLLPLAHLHTNRPRLVGVAVCNDVPMINGVTPNEPLDSRNDEMEALRSQWFFIDNKGCKSTEPVSAHKIKGLYVDGSIGRRSQVWASGLYAWRPLERVGQFYWTVVANVGEESELDPDEDDPDFHIDCEIPWRIHNESDLCLAVLKVINRLCLYYPSRNDMDAILKPMPRIVNILTNPSNLSTVIQLLLTFEPSITDRVADLLCILLRDNPSVHNLYETGCFQFVFMYQGSNLLPIARLLHQTHKIQATRIPQIGQRTNQTSILSSMLPEALVFYLDNYGPEKFAQAFVSEIRSPEVIWNTQLRRHLIERISVHIADFTSRLKSNIYLPYRYCPIPQIEYPEPLKYQLFCNRFYLNELLEHPNWQIPEPLNLLKDCIRLWRYDMEVKPSDISVESALATLELDLNLLNEANADFANRRSESVSRQIRQAYFKLAQKYHPDKNPGVERGKFEAISDAYGFLMDRIENNRNEHNQADLIEQNILTLLCCQVYLYKRFQKLLSEYRYPAYDLLTSILQRYMDDGGHCDLFSLSLSASSSRTGNKSKSLILPQAILLCVETVGCSPLNAEAFRTHSNSINLLSNFFTRCSQVFGHTSRKEDISYQICLNVVRFWTVAGIFPACRELTSTTLPDELYHIIRISQSNVEMNELLNQAMAACHSLSSGSEFGLRLFNTRGLWQELVKSIFNYDITFTAFDNTDDENNDGQDNFQGRLKSPITSDQQNINEAAQHASQVLFTETFNQSLSFVLPLLPHFSSLNGDTEQVCYDFLHTFHANVRCPFYIWNESCRKELREILSSDENDIGFEKDEPFKGYTALKSEPTINGIYIMPYLENRESLPEAQSLLFPHVFEWLTNLNSESVDSIDQLTLNGLSVIDALLGHQYPLPITSEQIAILASYLEQDSSRSALLHDHVCKIFLSMCKRESYVQLISNTTVPKILLEMASPRTTSVVVNINAESSFEHKTRLAVLQILSALIGNENVQLVKSLYTMRAHLHMMHLLVGVNNLFTSQLKHEAAVVLNKLIVDSLTGPRIRIECRRYIPDPIIDNLTDAKMTIHLIERDHDNPEFSWSKVIREQVASELDRRRFDSEGGQFDDSELRVAIYEGEDGDDTGDFDQAIVCGVRLKSFISTPGYQVRFPHKFATALLERFALEVDNNPNSTKLDMLSECLLVVWQDSKHLLDSLPATGHLQYLIRLILNKEDGQIADVQKAAFKILCATTANRLCQATLFEQMDDFILSVLQVMNAHEDLRPSGAQGLSEILNAGHGVSGYSNYSVFIERMASHGLIDFLLTSICFEDKPVLDRQYCAKVVSLIKSMIEICPDLMDSFCSKYPKWNNEYVVQKHDLFIDKLAIPADRRMHRLAPSNIGFSGYLTDRPRPDSDVPPPIDQVDYS